MRGTVKTWAKSQSKYQATPGELSVEINIRRHQHLLRTLVERIELVPDGEELAIVQRSDLTAILTFACGKKNPTFRCLYKLEAVKLSRERGGTVAQAARDLDVHENVLRKWVREQGDDSRQSYPGEGQMKLEQLQIERLRRLVA